MNVKVCVVGELQTNCYILEKGDRCLIIDPGAEPYNIMSLISPTLKVVGIVITHGHEDHTGGVNELLAKYNCPLYTGNNMLDGKKSIDNFTFDVIHTPGHKEDSICIYFPDDKYMFVGDLIFKNSVGRTDLPGSSPFDMKMSLKKILDYPMDTTLCPGHYDITVLAAEVNSINYFISKL